MGIALLGEEDRRRDITPISVRPISLDPDAKEIHDECKADEPESPTN